MEGHSVEDHVAIKNNDLDLSVQNTNMTFITKRKSELQNDPIVSYKDP